MSKRLNNLVGPEPSADGQPSGPGLPDLVADVHSMMSEQKQRNDTEGMVGHRLDSLLQMMGQERERQASQQTSESRQPMSIHVLRRSAVEHVLSILDRQRNDNEMLLRALATGMHASLCLGRHTYGFT